MARILILFISIFFLSANVSAQLTTNTNPDAARVVTSDIELFWKAYDRARPENNLIVFRDEYLKKGSVGLKEFQQLRIGSSCGLVDSLDKSPKYYAALRGPSLQVASYEKQLRSSFRKLKEIYPAAIFPDIYFLVGKMNPAGTLSERGLLIGVDMFGKNADVPLDELGNWHKAVVAPTERIPFMVAHELIHYQQKNAADDSLLARSINEGVADFVAELIAGDTSNPHLHKFGNPIEKELWLEFKKEMPGNDVSNWLYQGDKAKTGRPIWAITSVTRSPKAITKPRRTRSKPSKIYSKSKILRDFCRIAVTKKSSTLNNFLG